MLIVHGLSNSEAMKELILSKSEHDRIQKFIDNSLKNKSISGKDAERLQADLNSAIIMESEDIPSNVVTLNSTVTLSFTDGNKAQFRIVYPQNADPDNNKLSVFSPLASTLTGHKTGDEIDWITSEGLTRVRIEEILVQPDTSDDFVL